jgi:predicted TIM-barrel fold metal-dependent hydrolase
MCHIFAVRQDIGTNRRSGRGRGDRTGQPPQSAARHRARHRSQHRAVRPEARPEGDFLSAARFDPILRTAARLGVPVYLHPAVPTRVTSADNYEAGLDPIVATRFAAAAWGWHNETGIHFLHLVLSGVFDRYPGLQIILGHWGEMIPWFLDRLDEALPPRATKLQRAIGDYVRNNTYYTPSGMFTDPHLRFCVDLLGTDRMIYSVDYPFVPNDDAVGFLSRAKLSDSVKEDIAHRNAERLLGLWRTEPQNLVGAAGGDRAVGDDQPGPIRCGGQQVAPHSGMAMARCLRRLR